MLSALAAPLCAAPSRTEVAIDGDRFLINGKPTYAGRTWKGKKIEGLLLNSRMIQGVFDDRNSLTVDRWKYPDTGKWDADRNTREFIAAMPEWRRHGLLSFTVGMQGGSPEGYSKTQPWETGAYRPDGSIYPEFRKRLGLILDRANELGMVPIVSAFYFGQDERLTSDKAVRRALMDTADFILSRDYRNVLLEVANECDNRGYQQASLKPELIPLLIRDVQKVTKRGRRLLVGTSFNGGRIPAEPVVAASDLVILHGNGGQGSRGDPSDGAARPATARLPPQAHPLQRRRPFRFRQGRKQLRRRDFGVRQLGLLRSGRLPMSAGQLGTGHRPQAGFLPDGQRSDRRKVGL